MQLMNLFGLWMVLTSAWETNVSVLGDSLVRCNVPSATAGQRTSLTCYFPYDITKENRDVVIQHSNKQGQLSEIASCLWLTSERPTCKTDPGYSIEGKLSRNLTVRIVSTTEEHEGSYICFHSPFQSESDSEPCDFTLKEAIFKKITESTPVYSVPSTEEKNITTDDEKEGKNVIVIVIPVVLIILLLMCATVIFIRCRSRNSSIREFDKRVESHPLVPIRSPRMAITEATENSGKGTRTVLSHDETVTAKFCEFTQEEVFGKFGKYIYNRTLQLLQKTGAVVITGPERCGKSTLGRAVLDHFSTMGFYPLLLDHPNLWWKKKHDDKKHVVLLDECKFDVWSMKTVKSMLQDDLCYIMFVLRSDVMISECSGLSKHLSAVPIVDLGKKVPTETGHIKQLLGACKSGDLEKVITILSGGVDPNWSDREGKTPLHIACEHGQADIVSHLIWGGCDVNFYAKKLRTPLHYACKGLRQNSDDVADSDDKDVFSRPESKDCPRGTIVKSLIASGARLEAADTEGKTPLHMACEGDSYEMVNILLQAGANVKAKDKKGRTPLHVTCGYNNRDVTKSLVDAKSDVDASDNSGLTPLHVACVNKATDSAEILLRANASVNARANTGKTPLHMACYAGSKEIVDMLLDKGADVEVMDNKGVTPKADAKSKNHEDIARIVCPRHAYH